MEIGVSEIKQFITYLVVCLPRLKAFDRPNDHGHPPTPPGRKRAAGQIRKAALQLGMTKRGSPLTFQHSYAARLLENDYDIRTVPELLGHKDVKGNIIFRRYFTTFRINSGQAYTHMLTIGIRASRKIDPAYHA